MTASTGRTGREIAIVGMAGRYPDARSLAEFWRHLEHGVESMRTLSADQLRAAGVPTATIEDPQYVPRAAVLDDVGMWDAGAWGFTPLDAAVMDPQHRLFLECVWEALEDAGHAPAAFDGPIGVFAGCGQQSYLHLHLLRDPALLASRGLFLIRHTGNDKDFLTTRASYEMDLSGPSIGVQTACSTSLVAVHLAVQSLLTGECDLALAGGVTIELPHGVGYTHHEREILSPDGHCRSFDAAAAGTVFGSGAGVVALRRLTDAERDGDRVLAIIRGSAVNNDGAQKVGYLAPSVDGQAAAIAEALAVAGVSADDISYVEAHGTGTPVGDPIEVAALTKAFRVTTARRGFCTLGSVKPNIGHLDAAAGIAGLTKTVLALQHRRLPPTLHFQTAHPDLALESSPFVVSRTLTEWVSDGPRRAGVSSLGVGGTNAHVILEEAPVPPASGPSRNLQLVMLSAHTPSALATSSANLADHLASAPGLPLADVAFTLALGRSALQERRAIVAESVDDARRQLDDAAAVASATDSAMTSARPVFCFAGGGAQFVGMGGALYASEPVYRQAIDACLDHLAPSVREVVRSVISGAGFADIERPSIALPALFATQVAMARQLEAWGVLPSAMIGHSVGEYTAAHLAGVFSLPDAMHVVAQRGRLFERLPAGAMLSVAMPAETLRAWLEPEVSLAAINAPSLCVASGPEDAIERLAHSLAGHGVECQRLHIGVAAHSAMLGPILEEFEAVVRSITLHAPAIPFVSNVSGALISADEAKDPMYWVRHLRQTVRFADGVGSLLRDAAATLVDVGPGRVLTTLARQHSRWSATHRAITTMRSPGDSGDDQRTALGALGRLWARGVPVKVSQLWQDERRQRLALPTYPWERTRHWIEAAPAAAPLAPSVEQGARADVADWFATPLWQQTPAPAPLTAREERVLIFADTRGIGDAMAARLSQAARRVLLARAGTAFSQDGPSFSVRRSEPADYRALLEAVGADGTFPRRIVWAWGIAGESAPGVAPAQDLHVFLAFIRALAEADPGAACELIVVSSDLHRLGDEPASSPTQALVQGAALVMAREIPNLSCRSVDLATHDLPRRLDAVAATLAAEIGSESTDELVALRGSQRYTQKLEPVRLPLRHARLVEGGVYLITGGLSGVGFALACELAKRYRARLVLLSRRDLAGRSLERTRSLEALGAEVLVITADVSDVVALRTAIGRAEARFGRLQGVFHAAGVLADGLTVHKTAAEVDRVLAAKVAGTLALDAALGDRPLDCFVLFSSISARAGLPGQADYAAANAFLDAFAIDRRNRRGQYTVSIAWGAWSETGMAARGSEAGALHTQRFDVKTEWLLNEHRLRGGSALLPGTAFVELAYAAATDGGASTVDLRDVSFRSPFMVADGTARELQVHRGPAQRGARRITIAGAVPGRDGQPRWQEHVTARLVPFEGSPPAVLDIASIERRCNQRDIALDGSEQHPFVAFGARWRNLRRIRFGRGEALAELTLDDAFTADLAEHPLHPALLDMATAFGVSLGPGVAAERDFYVPLSYGRLVVHAPLGAHILSHARLSSVTLGGTDTVVLDLTITDPSGHVLIAIEEFTMTRVASARALEDASARAAAAAVSCAYTDLPKRAHQDTAPRTDGIRTADGLRALAMILSGPDISQVAVTPVEVNQHIAALRQRTSAPRSAEQPPAPAVAATPLPEVEAVLTTHESVSQGVVLQRPSRQGDLKLVAYVVLASGEHATVSDLRRFLKSRLPDHLVPSAFVELDALPLQADGAVDRVALPDPFGAADNFAAPQSETERAIAEIWQDVLGLPRVGLHDNFFDAGGHSLLSVRAITRIGKRLGVHLEQSVMVLQTLGQVAAECDRRHP